MALMAGALLLTLSVSAALGAAPTTAEGNRGQSIASFVHEVVFGNDETQDDADEDLVEDEDEVPGDDLVQDDEDTLDDELDDELDEDLDDDADDEESQEADDAHGQCVAEEASDKSDEVDEDRNPGAVVSEAARETCWETD